MVLSLTEVSGSTPSTAMSSTRPRHTKSMSSSGHPSKSTLPPIEDNTELKARCAARPYTTTVSLFTSSLIFYIHSVAPLLVVPPTLRLHTVLAPRRRTDSPADPPVAAPSTELSSETDAAPPITALQLHPHCPMTRGLSPSSAGARPLGSSARSPQSLSAGQ